MGCGCGVVLSPKAYARELDRQKARNREQWNDGWGEMTDENLERVARNVLMSVRVFEDEAVS